MMGLVIEKMRDQAIAWADNIRHGRLDRPTAWTAFRWTITKTLEYPLPATSLTAQECTHILDPALKAALPAAGINRHFPRAIVHGPQLYGGLQVPHLYQSQGIKHIDCLITQGQHPGITGMVQADPFINQFNNVTRGFATRIHFKRA